MAQQGIVTPLAAQQALAAAGPAWAQAVKALSPKITFVRGSIENSTGDLNLGLLQTALQSFKDVGLEVRAVLELNLGDIAHYNPNDNLGYQGDHFKNQFIESYTNNVIKLLKQLGPLCPSTVWIANEPNLQAAVNPQGSGKVIPQLMLGMKCDPEKPGSMSPEAYFSLLYHASYWIKDQVPTVKTVYPAAFTALVSFLTSEYDNWIGKYIDTGMGYLTSHGLQSPWPWSGLSLNMEGLVTKSYASYTASGLAKHKSDWKMTGPNIIGEWGVPNDSPGKPLNMPAILIAAQSLNGICESMSFYSAQATPGDRSQKNNVSFYGCRGLSLSQGQIMPGTVYTWTTQLPVVLDTLD